MSARGQLFEEPLTAVGLEKEMRKVLPRRNNFCIVNYEEIAEEARSMGLRTRGQVRKVLLRHRKHLLNIDRAPIDAIHIRIYSEDMGDDLVKNLLRRQMWFAWEGLFRLALELEFGEKYVRPSVANDGG